MSSIAFEEPLMLLKCGDYEFMHSLLTKGEVFLNSIDSYKTIQDKEIGDDWENINSVRQAESISICDNNKNEWKQIASNIPVRSNNRSFGNVYCMYGVRFNHFQKEPFLHIVPTKVTRKFGDTMVMIFNPVEFINRIKTQLTKLELSIEFRFVQYYNEKEIDGDVTVFSKRNLFSHQSEFRIFVENIENKSITVAIGSIEDIAQIIDDKMIKYVRDGKEYILVASREELSSRDIFGL